MTKPENGSPAEREPMRIIEFRAEAVKRLKAVTIRPDPEEPIVQLTGKNRQGKTSVIDGICWALFGKSNIPSRPIRDGETSALIKADLGEYTITRKFTERGEYLEIRTKDGAVLSSPQVWLNSHLGTRAENPLKFMALSPSDQVKALQELVRITLDLDEFNRITGLPTKGLDAADPVTVLDKAYSYFYGQRTDENKEVARLKGVVETVRSDIPKGMESTLAVSVQELFAERKSLEAKQYANDRMREKMAEYERGIQGHKDRIAAAEREVNELERKLLEAKKHVQALQTALGAIVQDQYAPLKEEVASLVDPDFTDIDSRIAAADETNRVAAKVSDLKKAETDFAEAQHRSDVLTGKLNKLKDYKTSLIASAGLPVPGLGFEGGEVTYNGKPLSQASTAEQIEISCAICMANHPDIRILLVDRGWSDLDGDSKQALRKWAETAKAQIWVTKVADDAEATGFHIIDGELAAVNGKPYVPEPEAERSDAAPPQDGEPMQMPAFMADVPKPKRLGKGGKNA